MIKIISNEGCTNCENVKKYLDKVRIQFEEILIDKLPNVDKEKYINIAKEYHQLNYPIILNGEKYTTFSDLQLLYGKKVIKRNERVVKFNTHRVTNAIENAMFETGDIDYNLSEKIANDIESKINGIISVEEIQDLIEKGLMKYDRDDIAKRYKLYRKIKTKERKIKAKLPKESKFNLLSDNFLSKYKHKKAPFTQLGEFVYYRTYSRWIPEFKRREYWWETVARVVEYNCSLLPTTKEEAEKLYDNIFNLRQFPSGRSLWIAGTKSANEYPLSNFNCSFIVIDNFNKFVELFHALLVGAGVGFRVLFEDVTKMSKYRKDIELVHKPYKSIRKRYRDENTSLHIKQHNAIIEIGDSKDGWTKALEIYFNILTQHEYKPINTITFNYDNVRPFGEKLKTFGGYASGYTSIQTMFMKINNILINKNENILKPIDCIDIANIIAENVIVGGVRRSAEIALIDEHDKESISAKSNLYTQDKNGNWNIDQNIEHRRMSNNTIWYRKKPTREQLHWNLEQMRYSGEPGFANEVAAIKRNPNAKGLNPCFTGDMKLLTDKGYIPIAQLEDEDFNVINKEGNISKGKVWCNGEKETIAIKFTNNKQIKCTPNHIFMLNNGEKCQAKYLKNKRIMPYIQRDFIENALYIKLGFIQGDGCTGRINSKYHQGMEVNIGYHDSDIKTLFKKELVNVKPADKRSYYIHGFNDVLIKLGFDGAQLPERVFPITYTSWDVNKKSNFLNGCYSANGSIITHYRISYKTTSKVFALQLKKALEEFNITANITINKPKKVTFDNGEYICKKSYDVNINKYKDVAIFYKYIGFYQKYKMESLSQLIREKSPMIISVKSNGVQKVYDFTEPELHWGIVEGFVAHNCAEVILDDRQTCNLSVVNLMAFVNDDGTYNKEKLFEAQKLSTRLAYRMTNVNLEIHEWDRIQKRDRLLGCDITGDQDFINATKIDKEEWNTLIAELKVISKNTMTAIAKENDMNESLLLTAGKPNGTLALLPTVSAGIHYSHSPYYIRRVRISASDPLCKVVEDLGYPTFPEVGQTEENCDTKVIEFPVKAPEGKTKYDISAIEQLENYKDMVTNYVEMNQSITVTVRNNEWGKVEQWLWDNWDSVVAISFLPLDDSYYQLLPYEAITKEEYNKRVKEMKPFDPLLIQKYEKEETEYDLEDDPECSTGACPIR